MIKKKDNKGIIIIYSVLIVGVLLSVSLGFAGFIYSDIRQAGSIDNSVVAYYASDSGLEQGLYWLSKSDSIENIGDENTPNTLLWAMSDDYTLLSNGAKWSIADSSDHQASVYQERLDYDNSIKLYFLGRFSEDNDVKSVAIEWYKGDMDSQMRVIFTQLRPQLYIDDSGQQSYINFIDIDTTISQDTNETGKEECFDFKDKTIEGNNFVSDYVVEIMADGDIGSFIEGLTVNAYNEQCAFVNENSQINETAMVNIMLYAVGEYGRSKQATVAYLPPKITAGEPLDYVLFFRQDVIDDNSLNPMAGENLDQGGSGDGGEVSETGFISVTQSGIDTISPAPTWQLTGGYSSDLSYWENSEIPYGIYSLTAEEVDGYNYIVDPATSTIELSQDYPEANFIVTYEEEAGGMFDPDKYYCVLWSEYMGELEYSSPSCDGYSDYYEEYVEDGATLEANYQVCTCNTDEWGWWYCDSITEVISGPYDTYDDADYDCGYW